MDIDGARVVSERTVPLARAAAGAGPRPVVREVIDHYGEIIVRAKYDGNYDKTNLPDELIMSSYFALRDDKIVSLAVIFNQPSPY